MPVLTPQQAGEVLARYTPIDFLESQTKLQGDFQKYGLGLWNESLYYAIYMALVAPWVQLPAVIHIIQKVANTIACLPCGLKNRKTGEVKDLPLYLRMPLGTDNPSVHTSQLWEDIAMSLFLTGCAGVVVTTNNNGRPVRVTTIDSIRMQVCGTFAKPFFHLSHGAINVNMDTSGTIRKNEQQIVGDIWPGGKAGSPHKMLYMAWLRSPETMRGIPAGLLAASTVNAAISTEEYSSDYHGDWQQLMIAPRNKEDMGNAQATMDNVLRQIDDNRKVVTSAAEMMVERLGLTAQESDIVASRVADQGFLASMYGVDPSVVNPTASSFSHLWAARQSSRTDVIDPLLNLICQEFSRITEPGWDLWFDRNALDRGDPETATKLAAMKVEKGLWSVNDALQYLGDMAKGDLDDDKNPHNRITVNGNRIFLDKLDDKMDTAKQPPMMPGDTGRPNEMETPPKPDFKEPPDSETPPPEESGDKSQETED